MASIELPPPHATAPSVDVCVGVQRAHVLSSSLVVDRNLPRSIPSHLQLSFLLLESRRRRRTIAIHPAPVVS